MARMLSGVWGYKLSKKTKKKKSAPTRLTEYAKSLNDRLPRSEKWFQALYTQFKIKNNLVLKDKYNHPYCGYIPDVINKSLKYIIEVDGSIHNLPQIKLNDLKKENIYIQKGYKVFRIKAFSLSSYSTFEREFTDYIMARFNNS